MEQGLKLIGIRMAPEYHQKLNQMALNRSAELGKRVSTGFIIQELIAEHEQLLEKVERSPELFGSRD